MWLLRAKDAIIVYFVSPEHILSLGSGGYAILSHVWGENEQTFQDVHNLPSQCAPGQTPRDIACEKIRRACELAEEWDYKWIWIDTCCIDQSSSSELSEAINSMFRYYSLAGICFAYLEDVFSYKCSLPADEFRESKWHTRGWTLQELIAPRQVVFISKSWTVIGDKQSQARQVEEATGVPIDVLLDAKQIRQFSIAQRMSWAARRVTAREEDEAYCLLGIFDINMPTQYGEGRKAFRRLQEEIMRQSADTTLFAWGLHCTWDELVYLRVEDPDGRGATPDYHLFATSPSLFHKCSRVRFVDPTTCLDQSSSDTRHDGYITFTETPYGVSTEIPIITQEGRLLGHLGWLEGRRFLLLLLQQSSSEKILSKDKLYRVGGIPLKGVVCRVGDAPLESMVVTTVHLPHVVYAPKELNDCMLRKSAQATWRRVYLAHERITAPMNTPELSEDEYIPDLPPIHQLYSPFHLDPRHLAQGVSSVFISLNLGLDFTSPKPADVAWTGDPPIILQLNSQSSGQLLISLGVCTRSDLPVASPQQVAHWAYVIYLKGSSSSENQQQQLIDGLKVGHNCSTDHISSWSGHSRTFTYEGSIGSIVPQGFQITLSFTTFESDPERTLVPHLHAEYVRAVPNDHEVFHHESHTGTAIDEPVIFEPPDMEQSQSGLSGDRSGWPPESRSRSKICKFLDGLRARWNSGWSRVATRHWRQKHTGTALERYPVEVETEVVRGAE